MCLWTCCTYILPQNPYLFQEIDKSQISPKIHRLSCLRQTPQILIFAPNIISRSPAPCTAWSCPGWCGRRGGGWRSCRFRPRLHTGTASPSRASRRCRASRRRRRGNRGAGRPQTPEQSDVSGVGFTDQRVSVASS